MGAVTWVNGATGTSGTISSANSLVGSVANDQVGNGTLTALPNGNYIAQSVYWNNGVVVQGGAVTLGAGAVGTKGIVKSANSFIAGAPSNGVNYATAYSNEKLIVGQPLSNTVSIFNPTYTAIADGNWSSAATWDYGAFAQPHDVVVPGGRTVTLDANVPGPNGSLTVQSGGMLIVNGDRTSSSPISNEGVIDLSSGKLDMGANTLTTACGGSTNGAGANAYVIGTAKKDFCSPGAYTFPVGTANGFTPVSVNVTAVSGPSASLAISSTQSVHSTLSPANSATRYWTLTETGDLTADLIFNYLDGDVNGDESGYKLYRIEGGSPEYMPLALMNAGANTVTANGVSTFSDWAVGTLAPTAAAVSISGRVTSADGRPVSGAYVRFADETGAVKLAVTNSFGYFRVEGLAAGAAYIAGVQARMYTFEPRLVSPTDNVAGFDFVGSR
jgi:hypothetical protein